MKDTFIIHNDDHMAEFIAYEKSNKEFIFDGTPVKMGSSWVVNVIKSEAISEELDLLISKWDKENEEKYSVNKPSFISGGVNTVIDFFSNLFSKK